MDPVATQTPPSPRRTAVRRTGRFGRGEGTVWLMGGALLVNVFMILSLVALIAFHGLATFWPRPVELVTLRSGESFLGIPIDEEAYVLPAEQQFELLERVESGEVPASALTPDGVPLRRLYRIGNRDLGEEPFRWVPLAEIDRTSRPAEVVFLEREDWGPFIGVPQAVVRQQIEPAPLDDQGQPVLTLPGEDMLLLDGREERITRQIAVRAGPQGPRPVVVTRRFTAEGPEDTWQALQALHPQAAQQRDRIRWLQKHDIGEINAQITHWRERVLQASIDAQRAQSFQSEGLSRPVWVAVLCAVAGLLAAAIGLHRAAARGGGGDLPPSRRLAVRAAVVLAIALGLFAWLERPAKPSAAAPERFEAVVALAEERQAQLSEQYRTLMAQIDAIREADGEFRVMVEAPTVGRFAPERQTAPDDPLRISQIVRMYRPNQLSFGEKLRIYGDRWLEFVTDEPRSANTEGGVFPVLFGTVLLTILLSIVVVPLGVLAALYLREYARQGLVTSVIRIAVNNLAGVPSIVYGVFGLGFFCYTVGGYIDAGPSPDTSLAPKGWWVLLAAAVVVVLSAMAFGVLGMRRPGKRDSTGSRYSRTIASVAWIAAAALAAALIATTPYFHGFFEARLPDPTFGKRGLLWASLTLALLTLPVVIVSTEEAIAAVQPSLREGSYGCGASKWQTIRRIVLPGATPGILTGMILAMARGAGEVAPLMLVGALKWAPELPVSSEPPFLHLERSFMHLGFHIYDLGFQSPDSEAARPLVWTSTLLLLAVVLLLNLAAITLRARVRRRMGGSHF